jgi:selenocysteine-specific elongation factor
MAILGCLVREKSVTLANGLVKCREYRPAANPQLQEAWVRLRDFLLQAGFRIPLFSEIDRDLGLGSRLRIAVVGAALKAGLVRQVNARRVALPATLMAIAEAIDRLAEQRGSFTVIEAKEQLGLGRDLTIELMEYFDSVRFTRRSGNARNVMDRTVPARLFANSTATGDR